MSIQRLLVFVTCVATGIVFANGRGRAVVQEDTLPANSAKALVEAAKAAYEGYFERRNVDISVVWDPEYVYRWSRRWLESERSLDNAKEKRVAASSAHLERMRKLEALQKNSRLASKPELALVKFYRIEAEQWLAEAKTH
jgi:hypothetical protein